MYQFVLLFEDDSSHDGLDLRNSGSDGLRGCHVNKPRRKKNKGNRRGCPGQVPDSNVISTQVKQKHSRCSTVMNDTIHNVWQESHDNAHES